MPVVTTDEIFGKLRYQALELGEAYGYVRVVGPGFRWLHADPNKKFSVKIDTEATDSSILLWGKEGQQLLGCLRLTRFQCADQLGNFSHTGARLLFDRRELGEHV